MNKRPVSFEDREGRTLRGFVVEPSQGNANTDLGFVYLPGVAMGVTAVHVVGLKVAEQLAGDGFMTALVDPPGIGESEGDFPEGTHEEVSDWVVAGNLAPGTLEIVHWMKTQFGVKRVAIIGHCGGALTGADCTAAEDGADGALLICPPPLRGKKGESEIERPEVANEYFKLYVRAALSPSRWKKLFTGETDYKTLATVVKTKLRGLKKSKPAPAPEGNGGGEVEDDRNFNLRVVNSMKQSVERGRKLIIIFGDKDIELKNFNDLYRMHLQDTLPLVIVEDTSHGFTTADGQQRLFDEARRFARDLAG